MTDDIVALGEVPDEVLLLCGRPASAPSGWWTPSLVDREPDEVEQLLGATRALLEENGVRDAVTGALEGPLGEVAAVVAAARVLVLLETQRPDGTCERRSMVVAEDRALLDRQDVAEEGFHELLLAGPQAAAALLAELLAASAPVGARVRALAGVRTAGEVAAVLPEDERTATTRVMRSVADDPEAGAHMVTVVDHPHGAVACWARPDGSLFVHVLDEGAVVEVALALLGAELDEEVAA